jgi:signal transduction histidine kinase
MQIRRKIALTFTALTACLLLVTFVFIYFFAYQYTRKEFFVRMQERVNVAAQSYLEQDEVSTNIYNEIRKKYLQKLPAETEIFIKVNIAEQQILEVNTFNLSQDFFDEIFEKQSATRIFENTSYAGLLYQDNQGDFLVVLSAIDRYGQTKMSNLRNILVVAFLISLVIIYLLGHYYAGQVLAPISEITTKVNSISAASLHLRLRGKGNADELDQLTNTFNDMLNRLETSFEIQNNFINNASHELRNPLTAILGESEISLNRERSKDEYQESLGKIYNEAIRLDLLINSLLKLAQTAADKKGLTVEPVFVLELLYSIKKSIDLFNPDNSVRIKCLISPEMHDQLIIFGNEGLLEVALKNIIENANKFSENQEVLVSLSISGDHLQILVKDRGVGIPAIELKNIFEPFYRASNVRKFKGFGVGLSLAHKIIKMHGGILHFNSTEGMGTEIKACFPLKAKAH